MNLLDPVFTVCSTQVNVFGGYPLGVSVTRAYAWDGFPPAAAPASRRRRSPAFLQKGAATHLLRKKLAAINSSSRNVVNHRWRKQILFVWAFSPSDATLLEASYEALAPELRTNTVLLLARCSGAEWLW